MNGRQDAAAAAAAAAASYTVEPLTGTDHSVKNIIVEIRYIISGMLDAEIMLDSLCDLIEKRWHHAGARMHKKPNGHLELHIPEVFDDACPPVLFDIYDADKETPLSLCFRRLPDTHRLRSDGLTFCEDFMEMTPTAMKLLRRLEPTSPNAKRCASSLFGPPRFSLEQLVESGGPMLTAALYRFPHSGETVVSVLFPHGAWDAGAMADFMRAWTSAVNNNDLNAVPEVLPLRDAPRSMLSRWDTHSAGQGDKSDKAPPSQQSGKQQKVAPGYYPLNARSIFLLVAGVFWRNFLVPLMHTLKPRRMRFVQIWIPQPKLDAWRNEAMLDRPANVSQDAVSFLSDNDLITSWATWMLASRRNSWLYGSFSIPLPVNMRAVDPQSRAALQITSPAEAGSKATAAQTAGKVILHNWLSVVTFSRKWSDSCRGSKWQTAWDLRQKLNSLIHTPSGVRKVSETLAGSNNIAFDESGTPTFRGGAETIPIPPWHEMLVVTNWTQSNFMAAANFHKAVIPGSAGSMPEGCASQVFGLRQPVEARAQARMFPQVVVFYKQPKEGILVSLNADEELIKEGWFGEFMDLNLGLEA